MLKKLLFVSGFWLLGAAPFIHPEAAQITDDKIEYRISLDQYCVVYINKESSSQEESWKNALEYAKQTARNNGYDYFKITKEQKVMVAHSDPYDLPEWENLYEEQIIQAETGSKYFQRTTTPEIVNLYPGYKLTIECFKWKPSGSYFSSES